MSITAQLAYTVDQRIADVKRLWAGGYYRTAFMLLTDARELGEEEYARVIAGLEKVRKEMLKKEATEPDTELTPQP